MGGIGDGREPQRRSLLRGMPAGWPCPCPALIFRPASAAALPCPPPPARSVMPAPAPRNVNWSALFRSWVGRGVRPMPVFVMVIVMLLIPIGLFAGGWRKATECGCCAHAVSPCLRSRSLCCLLVHEPPPAAVPANVSCSPAAGSIGSLPALLCLALPSPLRRHLRHHREQCVCQHARRHKGGGQRIRHLVLLGCAAPAAPAVACLPCCAFCIARVPSSVWLL